MRFKSYTIQQTLLLIRQRFLAHENGRLRDLGADLVQSLNRTVWELHWECAMVAGNALPHMVYTPQGIPESMVKICQDAECAGRDKGLPDETVTLIVPEGVLAGQCVYLPVMSMLLVHRAAEREYFVYIYHSGSEGVDPYVQRWPMEVCEVL